MPIIFVYGIPDTIAKSPEESAHLKAAWDWARAETAAIPELGLTEEQVNVFFPSDQLQEGLGEEIIIFVEGLFEKPERTPEVRQRLAEALVLVFSGFVRAANLKTNLIECFIKPFNPASGFASTAIPANKPSRK